MTEIETVEIMEEQTIEAEGSTMLKRLFYSNCTHILKNQIS